MRLLIALPLLMLAACGHDDPHAAAKALIAERCGACHMVPGVKLARGRVGPSLAGIAHRQIIAGFFQNKPDTMIAWLRDPQKMLPGNAMPDTGLSTRQARLVADYLYTLDRE